MPAFVRWATAIAVVVVVFSVRSGGDEVSGAMWSVGGLVAMGGLLAALGTWTGHRWRFYAAGLLLNVAATTYWWAYRVPLMIGAFDPLRVNIVALALPGIAWLVIDLRVLRRTVVSEGIAGLTPFHRVAAGIAAWGAMGMVSMDLLGDIIGIRQSSNALLAWGAPLSAAALVAACLWDIGVRQAPAALYGMGLVMLGTVLNRLGLSPIMLAWSASALLATYAVVCAFLWNQRATLAVCALRLGMPQRPPILPPSWVEKGNVVLAIVTTVLAMWLVTALERPAAFGIGGIVVGATALRMLAATAVIAHGVAMGLLAIDSPGRRRLQAAALWLGVIGSVAWGWALLPPHADGDLLHRAAILVVLVGAMAGVYSIALVRVLRPESDWLACARAMVPRLLAVCAVALLFILAAELNYYTERRAVPMAGIAIAAVAAALAGMAAVAVVVALSPRYDPFALAERERTAYVYAAEVMLVLLLAHIRLTRPEWFGGFFERFWPLVVMAVSFFGVGLGEVFRRQNQRVLAEPLDRTGAFLPLLPVIGFWVLNPAVNYPAVLLLVGALYGGLAIMRRSFGFGLLSALAGNGALWYVLAHTGNLGLHQHPQLWLIPPALAALAAGQLNRSRLGESQLAAIRYAGLCAIYVSSTADIFVQGVAESPWLPLVLMALSVAGVMAGVMLRVRAFLFLGTSFLVMALLTMIAHASASLGWTWLWWVAGIALGVLIVAVFALFEKKRQEVLGVIEGLRRWER